MVISVGDVFTYSELCAKLGESTKTSNSKTAQLKEWHRFFNWQHPLSRKTKKASKKFEITEIYDTPHDKVDLRVNNGGARENAGVKETISREKFFVPREHSKSSGIYRVINDKYVYIGQTTNFNKSYVEHIRKTNKILKDGGRFELIELVENQEERLDRERFYISQYLNDKNLICVNYVSKKRKRMNVKPKYKTIKILEKDYDNTIFMLKENGIEIF